MSGEAASLYEVVVGNVGKVYSGPDKTEANSTFEDYRRDSMIGIGRCGRETVIMFEDGGIVREYLPLDFDLDTDQQVYVKATVHDTLTDDGKVVVRIGESLFTVKASDVLDAKP